MEVPAGEAALSNILANKADSLYFTRSSERARASNSHSPASSHPKKTDEDKDWFGAASDCDSGRSIASLLSGRNCFHRRVLDRSPFRLHGNNQSPGPRRNQRPPDNLSPPVFTYLCRVQRGGLRR